MAITFDEFLKRFDEIETFLISEANKLIFKYENEVIKLSNEQLLEGKNVKGDIMQRGYSKAYAKKRQKAGLQTGFVDLKFTGKYQNTKKLVKYNYGVDIRSAADYEVYLRSNFPDHVGPNKKNAEIIGEKLAPDLIKSLNKYFS